jgi:hypothetical protein
MLAIRPVKPGKSDRRPEQRLFTIHQSANNVLAVRLNDKPEIKTCVISFSRYGDARRFGRLLERHRQINEEWPNFNFEDTQHDNILRLISDEDDGRDLRDLTIFEWSTIEEVSTYCALHFMDLMKMSNIRRNNSSSFQLQGDIYRLELEIGEAQKRLDYIFDIETRGYH